MEFGHTFGTVSAATTAAGRRSLRALTAAAAAFILAAACGEAANRSGAATGSAATARFDPSAYAAGDDWALPWPHPDRRSADGRLDVSRLPGAANNYLVRSAMPHFAHRLDGFSPNGAVVLPFTGDPGFGNLPAATATVAEGAPVELVNVEPGSDRRGERIPVQSSFRVPAGSMQPAHSLILVPVAGFPMAPGERYAAVVRTGVLAAPATAPPRLLAELAAAGVDTQGVFAGTVFRTGDPTALLAAARTAVHRLPVPAARDWSADPYPTECLPFEATDHTLVQGTVELPQFLTGPRPYAVPPAGRFELDGAGRPRVQATITVSFTLSLPAGPVPAGGWPLSLYMHGAGGDRHSFVRDGTACSLAVRGIAGLAIDFPLHGARNPSGIEPLLLLVNPQNPLAALNLETQAAIDLFTLTRLARTLTVPATAAGTAAPVPLRPAPMGFVGHSQGSLVGVPFAALEPDVHAVVFSGSGAHFMTFVTDRLGGQTIDAELYLGLDDAEALADAVAVALGIPGEPLDRFHPMLTMVQTALDPIDPVNFAPMLFRHTDHPKHVYQSAGFLDAFDPPAVNQALATAAGLDIAAPAGMAYPWLQLRGGRVLEPPVQGNVTRDGKAFTAVNSHFPNGDHWVYLDDPAARRQGTDFLAEALAGKVPTVAVRRP